MNDMGYLLTLQNLDKGEDERRDATFSSFHSMTLCFSTASTTLC